MHNFILIFLSLAAGIVSRRISVFPANSHRIINNLIIYFSFPALILSQFPNSIAHTDWDGKWWIPVSMAWICFAISVLFFKYVGTKVSWSPQKIGALTLTAGLGNTSFVGFPLLQAIYGSNAIPVGILVDQPGSFLALSSVGIYTAAKYSGTRLTLRQVLLKIALFPPFIAIFLSAVWTGAGLGFYEFLGPSFEKIGATLVPLAMFAVGFQLNFDLRILRREAKPLITGLLFKLLLIPGFFLLLYKVLLGQNDFATQVTILESAMATMITSAVIASEFNLDEELANLMVGISIPISLVSVPLWSFLLA